MLEFAKFCEVKLFPPESADLFFRYELHAKATLITSTSHTWPLALINFERDEITYSSPSRIRFGAACV